MQISKLFDLGGQVAVVTGGAGQFGTPIVEALAEAGALVVIASRSLEACTVAAARVVEAGGRALWLDEQRGVVVDSQALTAAASKHTRTRRRTHQCQR